MIASTLERSVTGSVSAPWEASFASARPKDALATLTQRCQELGAVVAVKGSAAEPHIHWDSAYTPHIIDISWEVRGKTAETERLCQVAEEDVVWRSYCSLALEALDQYKILENGWDGEDAVAPSDLSITAAESFLRIVSSNIEECITVRPMLDVEGVPGLFWDTDANYLSVSFYDPWELACVYLDRTSGHRELLSIDLFDANGIARLLEIIEALR